jgi:hypothetical protein
MQFKVYHFVDEHNSVESLRKWAKCGMKAQIFQTYFNFKKSSSLFS